MARPKRSSQFTLGDLIGVVTLVALLLSVWRTLPGSAFLFVGMGLALLAGGITSLVCSEPRIQDEGQPVSVDDPTSQPANTGQAQSPASQDQPAADDLAHHRPEQR